MKSCVKLLKLPIKRKIKKRKNAVSPDPDTPTVSKSVEIATSNDVTDVDSFSELIQLPVDEEVIPTQPRRFKLPTMS